MPPHDFCGLDFAGDFRLVPDKASLRQCSWHPGHSMAFCSLQHPGSGEGCFAMFLEVMLQCKDACTGAWP